MKVVKIIESKRWINDRTGQTASIFGAVPYTSEQEKREWRIESRGFTWVMSDGSIGLCRQPAKTYKEALSVMESINKAADERKAE